MVDHRFFKPAEPMPLADLLDLAGAKDLAPLTGQDRTVAGAADLDTAGATDIAFAASRKYAAMLSDSAAGVVIVTDELRVDAPDGAISVVATDPHRLFVRLLERLYPSNGHRTSLRLDVPDLGEPKLEEGVSLETNVLLGSGVEIGSGTRIGANTVIGPGVTIGRNCEIGPGSMLECCHLGDEVIVLSGARLGGQGFGWLDHGRSNIKIPQLGRLIVQSHAEIGTNAVVDRGALGDTVVGEGSKLGALVEIGHNTQIGRYCLLAPTSGLSGGTIVGDHVVMGAGVGTSGHLTIGSGSVVYGRAAVTKDWPENSQLCGAPAQDIKDFWRELAVLRRLRRTEGDKG